MAHRLATMHNVTDDRRTQDCTNSATVSTVAKKRSAEKSFTQWYRQGIVSSTS